MNLIKRLIQAARFRCRNCGCYIDFPWSKCNRCGYDNSKDDDK